MQLYTPLIRSVDPPAVEPHFAAELVLELDRSHLRQRIPELLIPCHAIHNIQIARELRLEVMEQRHIGPEQHLPRKSVAVVVVVHHERRRRVQVHHRVLIRVPSGALPLQLGCICRVQRRIHAVWRSREVVQAVHEVHAVRFADGVSTYEETCD